MNTTKLLFRAWRASTLLVVAACVPSKGTGLGGGVPGSKLIKTETRHTGVSEVILLEYPADVTVQQGAEDIVWIQADDNLLPQISTDTTSGRLTIKTTETDWNARVNPSKPVKIAITLKNPKEITFSTPVGTAQLNDLKAETVKLVLSGGGHVSVTGIQVGLLEAVLSGAGDIQATGVADEIKVLLSGWGNFNAADLQAQKATIDLIGAGDVIVRVEQELAATITGAGSVKYFGEPRVEQTISGAGSVKPAD